MKKHFPNALTILNLLLGVIAIILTLEEHFYYAALMIVTGMLMDGLDGRVARLLQVSSDFGKELDSLSDLVTFGVAPGLLAYATYLKDLGTTGILMAAGFAICGAIRLARFNVMNVKGHFVGLPIPAAGCIVATFIMYGDKLALWVFPVVVPALSYLMVSRIKYPDFKKAKSQRIKIMPILLVTSLFIYAAVVNPRSLVFMPLLSYAIYGIVNHLFTFREEQAPEASTGK